MNKYEIQEFCLFGGWQNTWSWEENDGSTIPCTYDTKKEAEIALDYFFEDCKWALDEGHMPDIPDREDFRIMEINND